MLFHIYYANQIKAGIAPLASISAESAEEAVRLFRRESWRTGQFVATTSLR